jgi:DNA-binding HxlR family transcriptional regulator
MTKPLGNCPADRTISIISGRWKVAIVFHLLRGTKRFSELHRLISHASQRVLTQQLRELEADGVVTRKIYAQVPPKVEYSLTSLGRSLQPVVVAMEAWGREQGRKMRKASAGGIG